MLISITRFNFPCWFFCFSFIEYLPLSFCLCQSVSLSVILSLNVYFHLSHSPSIYLFHIHFAQHLMDYAFLCWTEKFSIFAWEKYHQYGLRIKTQPDNKRWVSIDSMIILSFFFYFIICSLCFTLWTFSLIFNTNFSEFLSCDRLFAVWNFCIKFGIFFFFLFSKRTLQWEVENLLIDFHPFSLFLPFSCFKILFRLIPALEHVI